MCSAWLNTKTEHERIRRKKSEKGILKLKTSNREKEEEEHKQEGKNIMMIVFSNVDIELFTCACAQFH